MGGGYPLRRYIAAVLIALFVCGMNLKVPVLVPNFFRVFVGFFSGCIYCNLWKMLNSGRGKAIFTGGCTVIAVICWYFYIYHTDRMVSNWIFVLSCFQYPCTIIAFLNIKPIAVLASLRPFQWLGKISYGIFLTHWSVLLVAIMLRASGIIQFEDGSLKVLFIVTAAVLAVSTATYWFIEKPAQEYIRNKYQEYKGRKGCKKRI